MQLKIKLLKKRPPWNKRSPPPPPPPPPPPTPTRLINVGIKEQFENHDDVGHLPQRRNDTGVGPVVFQSFSSTLNKAGNSEIICHTNF